MGQWTLLFFLYCFSSRPTTIYNETYLIYIYIYAILYYVILTLHYLLYFAWMEYVPFEGDFYIL